MSELVEEIWSLIGAARGATPGGNPDAGSS